MTVIMLRWHTKGLHSIYILVFRLEDMQKRVHIILD
jgi:hypothetical protein